MAVRCLTAEVTDQVTGKCLCKIAHLLLANLTTKSERDDSQETRTKVAEESHSEAETTVMAEIEEAAEATETVEADVEAGEAAEETIRTDYPRTLKLLPTNSTRS